MERFSLPKEFESDFEVELFIPSTQKTDKMFLLFNRKKEERNFMILYGMRYSLYKVGSLEVIFKYLNLEIGLQDLIKSFSLIYDNFPITDFEFQERQDKKPISPNHFLDLDLYNSKDIKDFKEKLEEELRFSNSTSSNKNKSLKEKSLINLEEIIEDYLQIADRTKELLKSDLNSLKTLVKEQVKLNEKFNELSKRGVKNLITDFNTLFNSNPLVIKTKELLERQNSLNKERKVEELKNILNTVNINSFISSKTSESLYIHIKSSEIYKLLNNLNKTKNDFVILNPTFNEISEIEVRISSHLNSKSIENGVLQYNDSDIEVFFKDVDIDFSKSELQCSLNQTLRGEIRNEYEYLKKLINLKKKSLTKEQIEDVIRLTNKFLEDPDTKNTKFAKDLKTRKKFYLDF